MVDDLFNFPIGSSDGDGGDTKVHLITGGQTWSFGRSLLLDSAVGVSMMDQFCSSADFGLGMLGLDYGIPGTNDQGRGDPRYAGMPEFRTGFQALGNSPTWTPTYRDEGTTSFSTNVTKVAANHDFRFGYRLDYLHLDNWQPERANPRGRFDFASNSTRTFGTGSQTANFYNQYAAFLLGLVGTARKSYQYELFTGREWQHAMYVRDRWTVNQKLTLDLGVRWEYYPIMTPRRSSDRDDGPQHARRPDWRGRRQPEEHGPGGAEGLIRAEDRRRLSSQRRDGVPQRLWRHARRERDVGAGSVSRRLQLPARAERVVPAGRRYEHASAGMERSIRAFRASRDRI